MNVKALKISAVALLVLLVLQYILGMVVATFTDLNFAAIDTVKGSWITQLNHAFMWAHLSGPWVLRLHVANAILLGLLPIYIFYLGIRARQPKIWGSMIAFEVFLFVAAHAGAAFLAFHGQPGYSLTMALAFLAALGVNVRLLWLVFQ